MRYPRLPPQAISGTSDGYADLLARPLDGSHTDAVWQLQWVEKSQGRGERLVSISADGKVKEWSTKKGLVCIGACPCVCVCVHIFMCVSFCTSWCPALPCLRYCVQHSAHVLVRECVFVCVCVS